MDKKRLSIPRIFVLYTLLALFHGPLITVAEPVIKQPPQNHHHNHHHHHHQSKVAATTCEASVKGLHLALTSLDDRLVAYQYTDPAILPSSLSPPEPTETPIPSNHEPEARQRQHHLQPDHVQQDLKPSHVCHIGDPCHVDEKRGESHETQPVSEWTDLHITSLKLPPPPQPSGITCETKGEDSPSPFAHVFGDVLQHGDSGGDQAPFSPQDQYNPTTTIAATTITFSLEPESDPVVHELLSTVHSSAQDAQQEDLYPIKSSMVVPEPTALLSKTSSPTTEQAPDHASHVHGQRKGLPEGATPAAPTGPPMPTPEPTAVKERTLFYNDNQQQESNGPRLEELEVQQPVRATHQGSQATLDSKHGSPKKKRIKRVTTLIIENTTVIKHRPKETMSMHDQRPAKEDHVLFDGGIEGDMVVSMVNEESSKKNTMKRKKKKKKASKKMTSNGHANDEL